MSISSLGMLGSMATNSLAQTKGSEVDRAKNETAKQAQEIDSKERAEAAAGIEDLEQETSAGDRDADGRRMWEDPLDGKKAPPDEATTEAESLSVDDSSPKSKDSTGDAGKNLDLSG
jgi:hypothetical protein